MTEDRRYHLIDALRGLALVNMLAYHFLFDVNVVYGRDPQFFLRPAARVWQQCICWTFILIAGVSYHFGKRNNLRRGLLLNACGLIIPKQFELDGAFGEGRVDDKLLTIGERDAGTADTADPGFVRRNGDRIVIMRHDLQIGFAALVMAPGQHKGRQ